MEIVENTLRVELESFLDRPLFCFFAQVTDEGPRITPRWFCWEDGSFWMIAEVDRSSLDRIEYDPRAAAAVLDFDPGVGRIEHVGARGLATVTPFETARAHRLLRRYLGDDRSEWDDRFVGLDGTTHRFIRLVPETVVARDRSYRPASD